MNSQNQKNSIRTLVSLMGVASASVLLSFPASALINSNSGRQLLAQGTSGTTQQNPTGTGTNQQNPTGTGTTQQNPAGTTQSNRQRGSYTQYMNAGYAATQQRDYQTALINFRRALNARPGDAYATQAIRNVESYIQRTR